jgi:signal transduction histidine kinase
VTIHDDGCGVDPNAPPGRGLRGMQERVRALGGSFEIEGAPQGGTSIRIAIPVKPNMPP